jgi:16S rRNA (cytidine1402-2'-O)-methyltransferase
MGTLYLVATSIGNLEDMTLRALRILREVSLIAAEDTRTAKFLLNHYDIKTPATSYHEYNKLSKLDAIYSALAAGDVALVSDAGTPGISDPGYELIKGAIERGYTVVPIPGANAAVSALIASGLPTDSFIYLGFLPKKATARRDLLQSLKTEKRTLIAYESPYRLNETLTIISDIFGERPLCVAREITKLFEEFFRGTAQQALDRFGGENPKGEITLVIGGAPEETSIWDEMRVRRELEKRVAAGDSLNAAAKAIAAEAGWKKSDVYALGLTD